MLIKESIVICSRTRQCCALCCASISYAEQEKYVASKKQFQDTRKSDNIFAIFSSDIAEILFNIFLSLRLQRMYTAFWCVENLETKAFDFSVTKMKFYFSIIFLCLRKHLLLFDSSQDNILNKMYTKCFHTINMHSKVVLT